MSGLKATVKPSLSTETLVPELESTRCYLCGGSATRLVAPNAQYSYLRCTSCGFRRQHPLPDPEESGELYDEHYYVQYGLALGLDQQPTLKRRMLERRVGWLTRLNGGAGRVLDVGAGTGLFVEQAIRAGWQAVGVEPSASAVQIAGRITSGRVALGRVEEVPFEGPFDAVTLWDVLEHLPDPRSTLVTIRGLLRPGGIVGISLPNVAGIKARAQGARWRYFRPELGHLSHFSPRTLSSLVTQVGFVPALVVTSGAFNVGKPFGLDPVAVDQRHRNLARVQRLSDAVAGGLKLGEDLIVFARLPAT